MNQYRLDRRFVLQGIGITLLLSGGGFVVSMVATGWIAVIGWVAGLVLLGRAIWLWVRPPVVVRADDDGITLGGRFTVKPVSIGWTDVQDVTHEQGRLLIDRGDDTVVVFPLAFVGRGHDQLIVEVYERLNAAHGYKRFDPSES